MLGALLICKVKKKLKIKCVHDVGDVKFGWLLVDLQARVVVSPTSLRTEHLGESPLSKHN